MTPTPFVAGVVLDSLSALHHININQLINQSNNQPHHITPHQCNQSINQPNQSINKPNPSINQPINHITSHQSMQSIIVRSGASTTGLTNCMLRDEVEPKPLFLIGVAPTCADHSSEPNLGRTVLGCDICITFSNGIDLATGTFDIAVVRVSSPCKIFTKCITAAVKLHTRKPHTHIAFEWHVCNSRHYGG